MATKVRNPNYRSACLFLFSLDLTDYNLDLYFGSRFWTRSVVTETVSSDKETVEIGVNEERWLCRLTGDDNNDDL